MAAVLVGRCCEAAERAPRYEVMFADGQRFSGERLESWHDAGSQLTLDGRRLTDPANHFRWLRDRTKQGVTPAWSWIELVGGEVVPGAILRFVERAYQGGRDWPAHFVMRPTAKLVYPDQGRAEDTQAIRIDARFVQRIVWQARRNRASVAVNPGTAVLDNGQVIKFRSASLRKESVRMLTAGDIEDVAYSNLAELNMPYRDGWDTYVDQLATADPYLEGRVERIETRDGMIFTCSTTRFLARPFQYTTHAQNAVRAIANYEKQIKDHAAKRKAMLDQVTQAKQQIEKVQREIAQQAENAQTQHDADEKKKKADHALQAKAEETKDRQAEEAAKKSDQQAQQQLAKSLAKSPPEEKKRRLDELARQQRKASEARTQQAAARRLQQTQARQQQLKVFQAAEVAKQVQAVAAGKQKILQAQQQLASHQLQSKRHQEQGERLRLQRARAYGARGGPNNWLHLFQPAWSLGPISILFNQIAQRSSFAPHEVSLGRIAPVRAAQHDRLSGDGIWRRDRNIFGEPLISGEKRHGWGFGVHAQSEIHFPLALSVKKFQARMGLDKAAGSGGCVRARVFVNKVAGEPLYESPFLVGSKAMSRTPLIELAAKDTPRTLILQADSAHRGRPRGADPFDVRDMFNWLDPIVVLDAKMLREQVGRRLARQVPAWNGWTVGDSKDVKLRYTQRFLETKRTWGRFIMAVEPKGGPLVLHRRMTLPADARWLSVTVRGHEQSAHTGRTIALEIDGNRVARRKLPRRQPWQVVPPEVVFPVSGHQGKAIALRLISPDFEEVPLSWSAIRIVRHSPPAYRIQEALDAAGQHDRAIRLQMGQLLRSSKMDLAVKKAVLQIDRLGGAVNIAGHGVGSVKYNQLSNLLIGRDWKGGKQGWDLIAQLEGLQKLVIADDAEISEETITRIQEKLPQAVVQRLKKTPTLRNVGTHMEIRNRSAKNIEVFWAPNPKQKRLVFRLSPGQEVRLFSYTGHRWEAHVDGEPISAFVVGRNISWDVR